jgi:probable HAF family extracellular repeat protein/T5SS/PEP-CTERM-associated repeat protein
MKRLLLPILLSAILLVPSGAAQRAPSALAANGQAALPANPPSQSSYTVTDLGTLGGPMSQGMGTNDDGQVVGVSQSGSQSFGFLWDGATMANLGDLGGRGSWAYDVNDAGQVVGGSYVDEQFHSHAFRWQNGVMQDLGTLGGPSSYAFEINDSGQAVGYACCAPDTYLSHAVLWGPGGIVDLGDLDPMWPAISAAYGINNAGQVVGGSYDPTANFHAFLWQNGSIQDLGTLGGDYSAAEAINESGQVVGTARLANATPHAFLWDGAMQDLGALTWDQSIGYDINDDGRVVGTLETGPTKHAFLWADGQMHDLNTLIPSGSGWVLEEARAITNNGRIVGYGTINGQTHAFLLSPSYHWINPAGGSWHVATNWQPQGDPGIGDTVIFDLSGPYGVDATPTGGPSGKLGRMVVAATNVVEFSNLSLNLLDDSVTAPALTVDDEATVKMTSGVGTYIHALIGGAAPAIPPVPPASPPTAHLHVFNNGTVLTGTGRLTIGDAGAGELFVANGAELTSAEARLGGWLPGTAVVGGDGSIWRTGNLAVGHGVEGTLTIESGARVESNDAFVAYSGTLWDPDADSRVTVDGVGLGSSTPSFWGIQGDLTIGNSLIAFVEVLNGADLYVGQDVLIKNGELNVDGRLPSGDPSDLDVLGSVFVGGPGSENVLALGNAARGGIDGDLIIGKDGAGTVTLLGHAILAHPTQLDIVDPQAGLCEIGREFAGDVRLDDGGLFRCRNIHLGRAGTGGPGFLEVDGGMVRALDVLQVGQMGGGAGLIDMANNALVATNGTYIAPNGKISGAGTLAVNFLGLINDGTLDPAVNVLYPIVLPGVPRSAGRVQRDTATTAVVRAGLGARALATAPGTIVVDGDFTQGAAGTLVIEVGGTASGAFDVLDVRGAVRLGGTLVLRFLDGYLPQPEDAFSFLPGTKFKGAFDAVQVEGVGPGFDFALAPAGGRFTLTALSAATLPPCRDPVDADGDGVTCTDDCPAVANADQADTDGDQIGDACDVCTDGSPLAKPVLGLKKEKLGLKGVLSLPAAPLLQPAVTGARVTIEDGTGTPVATFDAPPGAFDAATKTGWKKLAYTSRTGDLRALKLGQAKKKPATVKIDLKAVLPGVDPSTIVPPITARILLEGVTLPTSLCGQVHFAGPPGVNPVCAIKRGALDCRARKRR